MCCRSVIKKHRLPSNKTEDGRIEREQVEEQKSRVKAKIMQEFHVKFDGVAAGQGSTNNGPTARKLFAKPKEFAGKFSFSAFHIHSCVEIS